MKFYNHETKMEYLETIANPDLKLIIESLFAYSRNTERFYQKDLYDFSLSQIGDVIRDIDPASFNSVSNTKSRIYTYITWGIKNGRTLSNIHPLQGVGTEWGESFLANEFERYLNDTDVYDLTDVLYNAQDKALIQCIFEGISGQGMSELLSMRYGKINTQTNEVTVINSRDNEERTLQVSSRCMLFIVEAYNETMYVSEDTGTEKDLINHQDFIFKKTHWRNSRSSEVTRANLAKRLYIIKEEYKMNALSVNTISISGRIKMAARIYNEKDSLTKEDFAKIGDQYNLGKMVVDGYAYYDITKMKHYINSRNFEELYGIEDADI